MARPLRVQFPGAWYHLTGRGNERRPIFWDDRDRLHFLELLGECAARYRLRILAYVLMDNHWHGLVQLTERNLSAACQWLGQSYATWFNLRHRRAGHLFQGRFKGIVVESEVYGGELSRYLHLNPVRVKRYGLDKGAQARRRAGVLERPVERQQLAARLKRLREYRWSSYGAYVGWVKPPGWLEVGPALELVSRGTGPAQRLGYRRYVEEAVRDGLAESPWEAVVGQAVLGGPEFVRRVRRWLRGDAREQSGLKQLRGRPSFEAVVAVVQKLKGEAWGEFRDRHGDWGRDVVLCLARRHCGLGLRELGARVGGLDYTSVSLAVKRLGKRAARDKALRRVLEKCEQQLAAAVAQP